MSNVSEERRRRRVMQFEHLKWISAISGLPICDINQCLNGAVFCIVTALACSPNDVDLSQVTFEAVTEAECVQNYVILQKLAQSARIGGLNHTAGLQSWLKLARSREDAFRYLKLLHKSLQHLDRNCFQQIEPEATAPPKPILGSQDIGSSFHTSSPNHQPVLSAFAPSDFGYRMASGSLEKELKRQASYATDQGHLSPQSSATGSQLMSPGRMDSKDSLYTGSDSDDSPTARKLESLSKLDSASSMASSVEAFLFPEDIKQSNDLVRRSLLDPIKQRTMALRERVSSFSSMESETLEVQPSVIEVPPCLMRIPATPPTAPTGKQGADLVDMIKDLDSIIASLKAEKKLLQSHNSVRSGRSRRSSRGPSPGVMNWEDTSSWVRTA